MSESQQGNSATYLWSIGIRGLLAFVRRLIERGRSTEATKEREPC